MNRMDAQHVLGHAMPIAAVSFASLNLVVFAEVSMWLLLATPMFAYKSNRMRGVILAVGSNVGQQILIVLNRVNTCLRPT